MAIPCLVLGRSGSGKSASLRNFEHDEIALVNVMGKPLPFAGKFDSTVTTTDYNKLKLLIFKTDKKTIVLDDFGYMMTNHLMAGKNAGGNKFDLFDDIASKPWELLEWVRSRLPEDKIVYFIMHEDRNEFGGIKPKTIGKMTDEKICLEGLFTMVIRSVFQDGQYLFQVHNISGDDVTKTPIGMFDEDTIENDLKTFTDRVREFYKLDKKGEE